MAASVYCTIFDSAYLAQALALHASLVAANGEAQLAFICMDSRASRVLRDLALERALVVPYEDFATAELDRVRAERTRGEISWTCKPYALLHLARTRPDASWLVYLDADMMVFGDPDQALPGPQAHYLLTPHRFHASFAKYAVAGAFNAGYFAMRNSPEGAGAVGWWRDRCLESCSEVQTETTYADQGYLDHMLALFPGGEASTHPGLNAGPWNIANHRVGGTAARVLLDGSPLLVYHFQALRVLSSWLVDLYAGEARLAPPLRRLVYEPYLQRLAAANAVLRAAGSAPEPGRLRAPADWLRLAKGLARGKHNLALRRIGG